MMVLAAKSSANEVQAITLTLLLPVLCFILIYAEVKITYAYKFQCKKKVKKGRIRMVRDKSIYTVCRMNFPLSQQGLSTHRVNIIGLNPG